MDLAHVAGCVLIVILSIMVFIRPYGNAFCYPLIFLLAALLNLSGSVNGFRKKAGRRNVVAGIIMALVALALFMLAIVSFVGTCRGVR